jgi:hypothetical protein
MDKIYIYKQVKPEDVERYENKGWKRVSLLERLIMSRMKKDGRK